MTLVKTNTPDSTEATEVSAVRKPDGDDSVYERCVLCVCVTDVPRALDVNKRCCYIDGAGQLCRDCYLELLREHRPSFQVR